MGEFRRRTFSNSNDVNCWNVVQAVNPLTQGTNVARDRAHTVYKSSEGSYDVYLQVGSSLVSE